MQTSKILFFYLFCVVFLSNSALAATSRQETVVDQAISGDSVRLKGGKILKYIGVDAPNVESKVLEIRELANTSQAFNQNLTAGKTVWIEWGPKLRDGQNRLLGYVFLADGSMVNKMILEAGQAKVRIKSPNLRYSVEFKNAEAIAQRSKLGIWEKELSENLAARQKLVGEKNTKIYYFHNSPELSRIPEANLVTFNSRVDAKAAGYRACSTCHETSDTPDE